MIAVHSRIVDIGVADGLVAQIVSLILEMAPSSRVVDAIILIIEQDGLFKKYRRIGTAFNDFNRIGEYGKCKHEDGCESQSDGLHVYDWGAL